LIDPGNRYPALLEEIQDALVQSNGIGRSLIRLPIKLRLCRSGGYSNDYHCGMALVVFVQALPQVSQLSPKPANRCSEDFSDMRGAKISAGIFYREFHEHLENKTAIPQFALRVTKHPIRQDRVQGLSKLPNLMSGKVIVHVAL
jgi:hypothetical protein